MKMVDSAIELSAKDLLDLRDLAHSGETAARNALERERQELLASAQRQLEANDGGNGEELSVFHRHLLETAIRWLENGLDTRYMLLDPRVISDAGCWSNLERTQNPSRPVKVLIEASRTLHPEAKYQSYHYGRVVCGNCRTVYRLENALVCPLCRSVLCYGCWEKRENRGVCLCGCEWV